MADFDAETWTAIATWVYCLLTAVVAVAAWKAWRTSQSAIQQARESSDRQILALEQSRQLSFRPEPHVSGATYKVVTLHARPSVELTLSIGNAGPGPALNVETKAWIAPLSDAGRFLEVVEQSALELDAVTQVDAPDFHGVLPAIGPNSSARQILSPTGHFAHSEYLAKERCSAVLLYTVECKDVFGDILLRSKAAGTWVQVQFVGEV